MVKYSSTKPLYNIDPDKNKYLELSLKNIKDQYILLGDFSKQRRAYIRFLSTKELMNGFIRISDEDRVIDNEFDINDFYNPFNIKDDDYEYITNEYPFTNDIIATALIRGIQDGLSIAKVEEEFVKYVHNGCAGWEKWLKDIEEKGNEVDMEYKDPKWMEKTEPDYYEGEGIQPLDLIESQGLNFNRGNVIKYVARAGKKSEDTEIQDLMKARTYIEREITRLVNKTK